MDPESDQMTALSRASALVLLLAASAHRAASAGEHLYLHNPSSILPRKTYSTPTTQPCGLLLVALAATRFCYGGHRLEGLREGSMPSGVLLAEDYGQQG